MNEKCICDSPNITLENTHYNNRNTKMLLLEDIDGYGILILENHEAISCFEINYCPKCGKKLVQN